MPTRRTRAAGTVAALALAAGTFTLLPGAAPTAAADTLVAYTGCEDLLAYYRSKLTKGSMSYAPLPPGMPSRRDTAAAPAAQARSAAQDAVGSGPTGTNVQERGVDEPDSAKTVGGLLFAFSEDRLQIVRTGAQPTVLSSFPLDRPAYGAELLVQDDRVLVETGRLGGLGKGERIFAVHYFGEFATVVTFRQTDPLYVIDLADPKNPRLLGELKVPGFSTYLHPVGGDRLLGVGQHADANGRVTGLQVSLFDLSDRSRPVRLDQHSLGSGYTPALNDSRAFGYDPERRLALLPLSTYDMTKKGSGVATNEALGIRVTEEGKLEPAGRLPVGPQVQLERVLHDSDHVYAVSRTGVVSGRAADLGRTGSVDFRR